jgi:hypothetical protein
METPVSSIVQTGDLGGQKIAMGIDVNAMAHIMSILTDLYSDPQGAVIREYSTNARDSHIEVGKGHIPIEITTPSSMSPYFKIKDYGIGLSVDDITNMYSQYGASTKRGTNEQTGMLGLGAKSALTLVPQFNMVAVKNGIKAFVSISRAADGSGQMEIIDTVSTTEGNGVEISIPIPRNHTFGDKVRQFFKFWPEGTVLVDGKAPARIEGRPVGDKFIIDRTLNEDYVVMGNVAYPVKEGLWSNSYNKMGIVAFVNIGDVNFTPSREALQYTFKTKDTVAKLTQEFSDKLIDSINKDIDDADSYSEAWSRSEEWRKSFGNRINGRTLYKGAQIPTNVISFKEVPVTNASGYAYTRGITGKSYSITGHSGRYSDTHRGVSAEMVKSYLFVTNFPAALKMSPIQREKAAIYVKNKGLSALNVMIFAESDFITNADHLKFLDGMHVVKWEDIASIKVPRNSSVNRVVRTDPYDSLDSKGVISQVSTMDTSKPIVFYSTAELRRPIWIHRAIPDVQVAVLSRNRWEKFKRDFPTALHWEAAMKIEQDKLITKLTEGDKVLWHYSSMNYRVKHLDAGRIDDPDLSRFITLITTTVEFSDAGKQLRDMNRTELAQVIPDVPDNPLTKYPLFANLSGIDNVEHFYWYLNTYYATLKEN